MNSRLEVGSIFETDSGQLRQIVGIATDNHGRIRISYNSKSAKIPGKDFEPGHTKANPPIDATFKNESGRMLTDEEIQEYVKSGILKNSELPL